MIHWPRLPHPGTRSEERALERSQRRDLMKRIAAVALLALALAGGAAQAGPIGVSLGVFAGLSIPVLQDVSTSSFSPSDASG